MEWCRSQRFIQAGRQEESWQALHCTHRVARLIGFSGCTNSGPPETFGIFWSYTQISVLYISQSCSQQSLVYISLVYITVKITSEWLFHSRVYFRVVPTLLLNFRKLGMALKQVIRPKGKGMQAGKYKLRWHVTSNSR